MRVARGLRRRMGADTSLGDIPPHHLRALRVVVSVDEPIRLGALADRLHIAPRSTTEVVDALEAKGLVARTPDPTDRRATCVVVTPEGADAWESLREQRHADLEQVFSVLSARDRSELARLLTVLEQAAPPRC